MRELAGMQSYMYMGDKMGAGQMFTLCASVVVPRVIADEDLQHAANELFRINDGMRARFVEAADGKVYQETLPFEEQEFEVMHFESQEKLDAWGKIYGTIPIKLDVRYEGEPHKMEMPPTSPEAIVRGIAHAISTNMKAKKLGLKDSASCCEVRLVQLPDASGAVIKIHHIVSDAWGMMLLANQFLTLLKGETPLAYQLETHLENEAKYKQSKAFERDLAFFENQLKEHPETPKLAPKPATSIVSARTTSIIDEDLTAAIRDYAANHNTSPYVLFLTAVEMLVRRELRRDDFYLGSLCVNRAGVQERNTVGLFVNTVFIQSKINGDTSFAQAVLDMRDANFSAFRHQRASNYVSNPLPMTFTSSYQIATLEADQTAICTQYYCESQASNDGMLTIEDRLNEGKLKMHFEHNLTCYSRSKGRRWSRFIINVIRNGIANDSITIDELTERGSLRK